MWICGAGPFGCLQQRGPRSNPATRLCAASPAQQRAPAERALAPSERLAFSCAGRMLPWLPWSSRLQRMQKLQRAELLLGRARPKELAAEAASAAERISRRDLHERNADICPGAASALRRSWAQCRFPIACCSQDPKLQQIGAAPLGEQPIIAMRSFSPDCCS